MLNRIAKFDNKILLVAIKKLDWFESPYWFESPLCKSRVKTTEIISSF